MKYRRFGRTELDIPVVSCGGMRFQHGWGDVDPNDIDPDGQKNLEACVTRALDLGINHIETARGYGSSEYQLGRILPELPRDEMIVQTKIPIKDTVEEFLEGFETSMQNLRLDHVDLLAIHGINNEDLLDKVLNNGLLEATLKLKAQGRCRFIGFSSHAVYPTLIRALETDAFDYMNLHYYYADQRNLPAVEYAASKDLGVFIISPTDKGGLLHKPSEKLSRLCVPLHPITFNGLFCLRNPNIHTLSCGVAKPDEFDELARVADFLDEADGLVSEIEEKLETELEDALGRDWLNNWHVNLPANDVTPGNVELYHTLRLYNFYKGLDMIDYARSRYNLLGNGNHWFPGNKVDKMDWEKLPAVVADSPVRDRIPGALREAHEAFNAADKKRLSQSG